VPNGFSLIEVLVALTVFAVAALALLRLTAVGLQGSGDLDRRLLREVVAGNLAAQWSTDPVQAGDGEGELVNAGRRFVWQRKVVRDHGVAVARIVVRLADASGRQRWSARRGWRGHEKERGRARRAARSAGFSLVEMLVALGIVALLALAGIDLLRGTVASEQVLRRHDGEAARLRRFIALWRADLAQAQALGTRDAEGARFRPFAWAGRAGSCNWCAVVGPIPKGWRAVLSKNWSGAGTGRRWCGWPSSSPMAAPRTRRWRFCRWPARPACGCATGPGSGARWAIRDGRRHPMACRWRCRSSCARRGWRGPCG
jgi:general secretion pathway protein I